MIERYIDKKSLFSKLIRRPGVAVAHVFIRAYQLTLSSILGRHCRHLPSCSYYTDEAIERYGFWPGGWMGFARICRCHPLGTQGLDLVPDTLPEGHRWYKPWNYGRWRGTNAPPLDDTPMICEAVGTDGDDASVSGSKPIP
ncbi:membrane protein insertion efficiency factor YidD [Pseudochelatococcus sp. G4_1912]|uniref:membrane protein insertion efficiency factor YidD n=1 Tax=Pseudochelatococcus sp. G4_1912 TaxID=3114288 RepID=UPI0039C66EF3